MIDYHLHVIAHGDRPMTVENILRYCEVAKERGVSQMGITEHDRYLEEIDLAAFQEARELSHDVDLRLGIEIDFVPGAEERMDNDATALPYDYVIGSVHRVDNEEVDRATDQRIYDRYETYDLYAAYYANVRKAALSGRFEVLGHPDLIKIFRHFPDRDITPILEETADAVAESGVVVDVNAAGLRKPVGEVYPAREFLEDVPQERRPYRPLLGCPRPGTGRNGLRHEPRARARRRLPRGRHLQKPRAGDPPTMTEELFLKDSYTKEFEARVVKLEGREVILDRTAFYPGGGGQPPDKGSLGIGPIEAMVVDVRREGGEVVHVMDKPIPDTVRDLKGELDWGRRFAHMRYHTALHVLSGVIWRNFDARVTGGQMRADRARMDFSFPGEWTADIVGEIERLTNDALAEERPVRVYELEREKALANPDLIRTQVNLVPERVRRIRIVEIQGLDTQADGGTHVANTREVGRIDITGHKSKGRQNKRIEFVLR